MNDDWRLRVDLHDSDAAHALTKRLEGTELQHDLERSFHDRVIVSVHGTEVFCYAATREQAERAEQLIRSLAAERNWQLESELKHWHPSAEEWEDPETPLPGSDTERAAERRELMAKEREESLARGYPEYEVRVQCPTRGDAVQLAEKLAQEGIPSVHRWKYLLVGALDEDSATSLAQRLRGEAPDGSEVTVEGTLQDVLGGRPSNPFAILGGLAG